MDQVITRVFRPQYPSAVLVGSMVGIVIALFWPFLSDLADRATDVLVPVVEGSAEIVDKQPGVVTVRLVAARSQYRDCKYLGLQAFSRLPSGLLREAYAKRMDKPASNVSRPPGIRWQAGTWDIWPTDSANAVVIYAQYDCGSRLVSSLLAEVSL
jgi:hypothetical protein